MRILTRRISKNGGNCGCVLASRYSDKLLASAFREGSRTHLIYDDGLRNGPYLGECLVWNRISQSDILGTGIPTRSVDRLERGRKCSMVAGIGQFCFGGLFVGSRGYCIVGVSFSELVLIDT